MTAPFLAPHRADAARPGRYKTGSTAYMSFPGVASVGNQLTEAPASNRDYYYPYVVASPIVVDRLSCEVTSAAAAARILRIGLYAADAAFQPVGPALADSGNIAADSTGVKNYTPGTPIYLPAGRYLGVYNCDGTPTLRSVDGGIIGGSLDTTWSSTAMIRNLYVSRTYAAFPNPGTAWNTSDTGTAGMRYIIALRVIAP